MSKFSFGKLNFSPLTSEACKVGWDESTEGNGAKEGKNIKGKIVIPSVAKDYENNKTYFVTELGKFSFRNCAEITDVILPDSLQAIRHDSFYNTSITKIFVPMSVKTLGFYSFSCAYKLREIAFARRLSINHFA